MDEVIFLISLNLGPAAGPVQAITIALQLPIIETRVTILLGLARADALAHARYAGSVDSHGVATSQLPFCAGRSAQDRCQSSLWSTLAKLHHHFERLPGKGPCHLLGGRGAARIACLVLPWIRKD